jgi:Holliday junction DNA helicase RuvA
VGEVGGGGGEGGKPRARAVRGGFTWGMITRLKGTLERVEEHRAAVAPVGLEAVSIEVLLPAATAAALAGREGQVVTLSTLAYLESPNQGATFVPRLIGFAGETEREFFELFTTVKGIGNRRALRAMAEPAGAIAAAIARGDAKWLTKLPEIGKRMADTVIAELKGKADRFADAGVSDPDAAGGVAGGVAAAGVAAAGAMSAVEQDAVGALVRLGEQRSEAERKVAMAVARLGRVPGESNEVIAAVFAWAGR